MGGLKNIMLKKILALVTLALSTQLDAMQPGQAAQPQGQVQRPKPTPKPKPKPVQPDSQPEVPANSTEPQVNSEPVQEKAQEQATGQDTNTDTQVGTVSDTTATASTKVEEQTKKHVRICPTCGGTADQCPEDLHRRRMGVLLPCACDDCC